MISAWLPCEKVSQRIPQGEQAAISPCSGGPSPLGRDSTSACVMKDVSRVELSRERGRRRSVDSQTFHLRVAQHDFETHIRLRKNGKA
ncbi:hypothetical protein EYF80_028491 [Liparis tanakae]|uniref:Uncharacterized protein n=1 Tax=Liparis tanakae TaxID=230148 RepID=A0A4Z2H5Y7_9TELE|nr:hypothetical protein EYF80_028491 [Liparis tanakae]